MADQLVLERLIFQGHIGVTAEERRTAQPIAVDLKLAYPDRALHTAAAVDSISKAVDYARVAARIVQVGHENECHLIETLAERLCSMLLAEFPVSRAHLWVRKLQPPVKDVYGSAGVRLERARTGHRSESAPARFLVEHWNQLPKGHMLDVAAGSGCNTLFLATQGYTVEAIDRDERALNELTICAREQKLDNITTHLVDLETPPDHPPTLPKEHYEGILVFFYLYRPIVPLLIRALKPGGVLMYETFLIENHMRYQHPRRREFCLEHNELLRLASGLRILYYDERARVTGSGPGSIYTARLLAQKDSDSSHSS